MSSIAEQIEQAEKLRTLAVLADVRGVDLVVTPDEARAIAADVEQITADIVSLKQQLSAMEQRAVAAEKQVTELRKELCELAQLRKLRDRLVEWRNEPHAGMHLGSTLKLDDIISRAREMQGESGERTE